MLHEMLTGRKAFVGDTTGSVMAAVVERDVPLDVPPGPAVPATLDRILQTCLRKEPAERWQSAQDLKSALDLVDSANPRAGQPLGIARLRMGWLAAAVLLTVGLAVAWTVLWRERKPEEAVPLQFAIDPPPGTQLQNVYGGVAPSPDGRYLVFNTASDFWLRPLGTLDARQLPVPTGNFGFWSPDSKSLAFFRSVGGLMRFDIAGGTPQLLCDATSATTGTGGTWNRGGVILFGGTGGLRRVSARGYRDWSPARIHLARNWDTANFNSCRTGTVSFTILRVRMPVSVASMPVRSSERTRKSAC